MGSHAGCSIIPGGIPPGTHLGSQVGLAGSHLIFLPGHEREARANKFKLGSHAETKNLLRIQGSDVM